VAALCPIAKGGTSATAPLTTPNCTRQQGQNLNGNLLPFSPKNKIALNGTYTWDLEDGAKIDASLSYFWQDVAYSSIFNQDLTEIPAWDQFDGRLNWTSADGNITLIGFIKNMFDEIQYDGRGSGRRISNGQRDVAVLAQCGSSPATSVSHATSATGFLAADCYTQTDTYRPPRTYGAELQIRF
jgi:outer membrane receptor protein involved in Fe transport